MLINKKKEKKNAAFHIFVQTSLDKPDKFVKLPI